MRKLAHAQLHHVTVTRLDREGPGCIAVDAALLDASGIAPLEEVLVVSRRNGQQWTTHVVPAGTGEVIVQGGAVSLFDPGHEVDIAAYTLCDETALRGGVSQRFVEVGAKNVVKSLVRKRAVLVGDRFEFKTVAEKVDSRHPLVL